MNIQNNAEIQSLFYAEHAVRHWDIGRSVADPGPIKSLLSGALTDKIDDRETFMKGIDYSYYYEQSE